MSDFPLFAYTVADYTTTNGGVIPSTITDVSMTSPDADFTVTNGGVTDGASWSAVQMPASIGNSAFLFRSARSGRVLELTINQPAVISIFMQDIETGQGLAGLGATMVVQLKKSNSAFGVVTPTITDRTVGWYDLSFLGSNFDTLGEGALHITAPGAQPNDETIFKVITVNKDDGVRMGLTALPNAAAGTTSGLPLKSDIPTAAAIRDAILDAARNGHVAVGSVGEAIALSASLLQGNFFIDNTDNTSPNGQTAARLRCFHTGVAAAAATPGGSGEGEFATFVVTTTYTGPNKIETHRVVQQ